jgi:hypothetical protein
LQKETRVFSSSSLKILMLLFAPPFRDGSYTAIAALRLATSRSPPRSLELREQSGRDRRERAVQHTGWGGSRSMNSASKHMLGMRQQGEHTRAYRVVHGGHLEDLVGNDPRVGGASPFSTCASK